MIEAMKQALEALAQVTKELLAVRDELAERGARPTTNVFHQRLWDSSFDAYTDHAIPAATSLRQAIEQAEKQEPVAWYDSISGWTDFTFYKPHRKPSSPSAKWIPLYTTPPAAPVQEPVALENVYETIIHWDEGGGKRSRRELARRIVALYTIPPAAQHQPLTDEEIDDIWNRYCDEMGEASINDAYDIARAIEAAHGIKEKNT